MRISRSVLAIWLLVLVFAVPGFAQVAQPSAQRASDAAISGRVSTRYLNSKLTGRQLPYRVILPEGYADPKARYPVIYLLHGLFGHFDNWTGKTAIEVFSSAYNFIIVMPEGGDGWYTDSVSVPADKYESYIVQELIPEIDKEYRTIADRKGRAIAGLSMGGYGALKFALKHPDKFVLAGSFSGALDAPLRSQTHQALRPSIVNVFGPDESPTRKDNDIYRIVREMPEEKLKSLPFFYLDCGTEDFLIQPNREFASLLFEKKILHEFRQLPGGHTWPYWESQVQEFLQVAKSRFALSLLEIL